MSAPGDLRWERGELFPNTGEERGRPTWTVGREAARPGGSGGGVGRIEGGGRECNSKHP